MTRNPTALLVDDALWYKDAVIYQLHVKSFCDSDNDGVGDFPGLISKLDYIAELGVDVIWLLPFYPSPRRDDGYDIAEYRGVHPDYGSMADVRRYAVALYALNRMPAPGDEADFTLVEARVAGAMPLRYTEPAAVDPARLLAAWCSELIDSLPQAAVKAPAPAAG